MRDKSIRCSVLVVDDDPAIRRALARMLASAGYPTIEAADAATARTRLVMDAPGIALLDIGLPDGSGLDLARLVVREFPDVAVIMISGNDDPRVACTAVDLGAYGYIAKPFGASAVLVAVHNADRRRVLERTHREQHLELTRVVTARTDELRAAMADAKRSYDATIERLSRAIDYRDSETSAHVRRMGGYCGMLAQRLGLDGEAVRAAGSMHDVGKIGVPDAILLKPGPLDHDERLVMERHTLIGHDLLSGARGDLLDAAATIALTHHERWDGGGYPNQLRGTDIPLVGRIAAVADVFDAITTPRVYRSRVRSHDEALDYIQEHSGTHFDPAVVEKMLETVPA